MTGGIQNGGTLAGTSYAANAQVFAPLQDETIKGGNMFKIGSVNYCDRGTTLTRIGYRHFQYDIFHPCLCHVRAWIRRRVAMHGALVEVRIQGRGLPGIFLGLRASNLGQTYKTSGCGISECSQPLLRKVQADRSGHTPHWGDDGAYGGRQCSQRDSKHRIEQRWNFAFLPNDGPHERGLVETFAVAIRFICFHLAGLVAVGVHERRRRTGGEIAGKTPRLL